MNPLGQLYSQANEMFWQQPKLWVCPLTAELVRYVVRLLANQAQHASVTHLVSRSVFGGYAGSGNGLEGKAVLASAMIGAFANGIGLLAYLSALGVTVRKVNELQNGGIPDVSRLLPNSLITSFLKLAGFLLAGAALASTALFAMSSVDLVAFFALASLLALPVLYLAIPTLQRYVRFNQNQDAMHTRLTDGLLVVQAFAISTAFEFTFKTAVLHDSNLSRLIEVPFWSFALMIPVVLVSAMPYVWSMIALGLNVRVGPLLAQSHDLEQKVV